MSSSRRPFSSRTSLTLPASIVLASWAGVGCEAPQPATEVVARIDSDLSAGSELTRVEAHVFGMDAREDELGGAQFTLSGEDDRATVYALPLSFSVAPQGASARRFRLVVAGYGRSTPSAPETLQVERQVIASFRPYRALRLDVFLGRICLGVLCGEDGASSAELTCGDDGTCGPVPVATDLPELGNSSELDPVVRPDAVALDAGIAADAEAEQEPVADATMPLEDADSPPDDTGLPIEPDAGPEPDAGCGGPSAPPCPACPAGFLATASGCQDIDECADATTNDCPASAPCAQTEAPGYTCTGQFADWRMPDSALAIRTAAPRYTVTGDVVHDDVTGLSFQRSVDPNLSRTWSGAESYCAQLAQGPYTDWRVPSRVELVSLLDTVRAAPMIDPTAFPGAPSALFWTRDAQAETFRWGISFSTGLSAGYGPDSAALVRCVRSPTVASGTPATHFVTDTATGTVTDTRTGLVWQRGVNSMPSTYAAAVETCRQTGRRLPSLKELLTLVDPERMSPALPPAFPPFPPRGFWTSSSVLGSTGDVYVVGSDQGGVATSSTADAITLAVRCVARP